MRTLIARDLDEATWHEFLDAQPDSNIFHTPEMFRVFESAPGHHPSLWVARHGSGDVVALISPVEVTVMQGPLRKWTSRAVAYGGVLCCERAVDVDLALCRLLTRYVEEGTRHVMFSELRHLSDTSRMRRAIGAVGFAHEDHLNFLISLRKPREELWSALSRSARQRVRSAAKKGVCVAEATEPHDVEVAYELLDQVYRTVHVPLASRELFEAAMATLHPLGWFRILTARLDDQVIAARFLLCYRDRVLDWYAGSDRRFASYSASELLVWHTLCWGQDAGFGVFDFGGAGKPDEPYGPREFKGKFGGELVDFGRAVMVHAPARLHLSRTGYAVTRRVLWRERRHASAKPR